MNCVCGVKIPVWREWRVLRSKEEEEREEDSTPVPRRTQYIKRRFFPCLDATTHVRRKSARHSALPIYLPSNDTKPFSLPARVFPAGFPRVPHLFFSRCSERWGIHYRVVVIRGRRRLVSSRYWKVRGVRIGCGEDPCFFLPSVLQCREAGYKDGGKEEAKDRRESMLVKRMKLLTI